MAAEAILIGGTVAFLCTTSAITTLHAHRKLKADRKANKIHLYRFRMSGSLNNSLRAGVGIMGAGGSLNNSLYAGQTASFTSSEAPVPEGVAPSSTATTPPHAQPTRVLPQGVSAGYVGQHRFQVDGRHSYEKASCAVCLCAHCDTDLCVMLPCGHNFHSSCIGIGAGGWFGVKLSCPTCAYPVKKEAVEDAEVRYIALERREKRRAKKEAKKAAKILKKQEDLAAGRTSRSLKERLGLKKRQQSSAHGVIA